MKKNHFILIVLSITSIVLVFASVGIYSIAKPHFEPKSNISKPSMNIKIYYPDWQFQQGKIIELEDKITLDKVETKEITQEEGLYNRVKRTHFVYTIKHELDIKGNKLSEEQYHFALADIGVGITKNGHVLDESEALVEKFEKDGDVTYTYVSFLNPVEQLCARVAIDKEDRGYHNFQCMKTELDTAQEGELVYPYQQGEVGKPVKLQQGDEYFTMTLTKVIRNEEFDETFLIVEIDPQSNKQVYLGSSYLSMCSKTEVCTVKGSSRSQAMQSKYEQYTQEVLKNEDAKIYNGGTLADFKEQTPQRFLITTIGSKSKKFSFVYNMNMYSNRNVYWELG